MTKERVISANQTIEENLSTNKVLNFMHNQSIDYDTIKKKAIETSPLVTSFPLSEFEVGRNMTIKLKNQHLPVTGQAYHRFLKSVLQVDPGFIKRFKNVTDEKTELTLLGTLKNAMAINKNKQVYMLANPVTREVTNFASGKHTFRSNESLLELFENVMNTFPDLSLKDFYQMEDGSMQLTARTEKQSMGTISSEVFQGGITFRNNYQGSLISHNAFRMICENGMFGFSDLPLFVGSSEKQLVGFFDKLKLINDNNWIEGSFFDKMLDAMETKVSVKELTSVKDNIKFYSDLNNDTIDIYLPEYKATELWLRKKGVEISNLNSIQEKNCITPVNMWDLINKATEFGSHDYGMNADFSQIQKFAGRLFFKEYDTKNLVFLN